MNVNKKDVVIMQFPEYKKSIVNLVASIQRHFGLETTYKGIDTLDAYLCKDYQHVILMIFDGMGQKAIEHHLDEESFLRQHQVEEIESVLPTTTTAAMTSYYSGLSPAEHGWLGWSLYFKDYGSMVDIFTNQNSYYGNPMETNKIAYRELAYESVFEKLAFANGESLHIHTIKPEDIQFPSKGNRHHPARDLDHVKKIISKIQASNNRTFTQAYWDKPDGVMHKFGPYSQQVKDYLIMIDAYIKELANMLTDTLLIISADHGQIEVKREINLDEDEILKKMLIIPPSVEPRTTSFFVKNKYKKAFENHFRETYGDEFLLFSHEEVVESKFFGYGSYNEKFDDLIGDYVAFGYGNSLLRYKIIGGIEGRSFKGHHSGVSAEEVYIPLIIVSR